MAKSSRQSSKKAKASFVNFYFVNDSGEPVTIKIDILSPGNSASTTAVLNGRPIIHEEQGSISERPIDLNNNLDGKTLTIASVVTHLDGGAAFVDENILLRGGIMPKDYQLSSKLGNVGKTVVLTANIEFAKL
jgi:hypothetical protein